MTWTVLHRDCEHQVEEGVVKRCHSNPEEVNLVDEHGLTPLHLLCFSNPSIKALTSLLETDAKVLLQQDIHGDTPLHIALRNSQVNIDAIILMINTCPNSLSISNKEGLMPLHIACRHCPNRSGIIELIAKSYPRACICHIKCGYLVKKKIDGDSNHQNHFIADTNVHPQKSSVDLKFDDYDKQVRDGAYPLHIALTNGASADVIEILLKAVGGNKNVLTMKNKFGKIPMEVAQQLNYRETVLLLLNPNR